MLHSQNMRMGANVQYGGDYRFSILEAKLKKKGQAY